MKDMTSEWNEASEYIANFRKRTAAPAKQWAKTFKSQAALEHWVSEHPVEAAKQSLRVTPRKQIPRNNDGTIFVASTEAVQYRRRPSIMRKFIYWSLAIGISLFIISLLFDLIMLALVASGRVQ